MDKTLKEKIDAWTDTDEHTEIPFRKRVQDFWKWFTDNEKKLCYITDAFIQNYLQGSSNQLNNLVEIIKNLPIDPIIEKYVEIHNSNKILQLFDYDKIMTQLNSSDIEIKEEVRDFVLSIIEG